MDTKNYSRYLGVVSTCLIGIYIVSLLGCQLYPSLAHECSQEGTLYTLLYGLLYTLIVLTLIIVPLIAIIYIRVTIIMPISKMLFDDANTLDEKLFGWFDKAWSYFQKLLLN